VTGICQCSQRLSTARSGDTAEGTRRSTSKCTPFRQASASPGPDLWSGPWHCWFQLKHIMQVSNVSIHTYKDEATIVLRTLTFWLVGVAVLAGCFCWSWSSERPLMYDGRPLDYWLSGFDEGGTIGPRPDYRQASVAVRQIGTNAVRPLLRLLRSQDSTLKLNFLKILRRQTIIKVPCIPASVKIPEATAAFVALGSDAQSAVPELIRIYKDQPQKRLAIASIFGSIGPPAKTAVPLLISDTAGTNASMCCQVIYALGRILEDPSTVVPLLIGKLQDSNDCVRYSAVVALGAYGTNARPAVPTITVLITKEKKRLRAKQGFVIYAEAEEALKRIDSEIQNNRSTIPMMSP
jgi:hypothetical protein